MLKIVWLLVFCSLPLVVGAQSRSVVEERPAPAWTVTVTGGFTNTFQLILGGKFGEGHDVQDKLVLGANNLLRSGDSASLFGWSTTDMSSETPNYQSGLFYKVPVLRDKKQAVTITAGLQRWILPLVGRGTKDWFLIENATYGTAVKRMPLFISEDAYTLVKSNLPTGSALYSQVYAQHELLQKHGVDLALREGPAYTYSWGLYGCSGNRVLRYGGSLVTTWRHTSLETGYRKQFGLQDRIPNNGYWSFLVTRQWTGPFRSY
jgi:hypothetical protein